MDITFEARCVLEIEYNEAKQSTKVNCTKVSLDISNNLDRSMYMDEDDIPTKAGCKAMTGVLVQSLICNIHYSHDRGFKNDAEHLRYIISELEKGFVSIVETGTGKF